MGTVTKKDLVGAVAKKCNCHQSVAYDAVQTFLDRIVHELSQGNRIELREFGVFEPKTRNGRSAMNPKTKAVVVVPPRASVKFKVGRIMKERVQALVENTSPPMA